MIGLHDAAVCSVIENLVQTIVFQALVLRHATFPVLACSFTKLARFECSLQLSTKSPPDAVWRDREAPGPDLDCV